jgi:hypothetical protein
MLGKLDSKLVKSNSDSSNFLANKLTTKPSFSSDSQERIYEVQVQLPQLGHELLSGDDFRDKEVMKHYLSSYKVLESPGKGSFVAFVGTHKNNKSLIVSFRGTKNMHNVVTNIIIIKSDFKGPPSCGKLRVSQGFLLGFETLKKAMFEEIKAQTLKNNGITQIIFTGHSLGGAMTSLAATEYLRRRELKEIGFQIPRVSAITFGAPRVGNRLFSNCLNTNLYHNFRVIYGKDIVTTVPPALSENKENSYTHTGTEIRYYKKNWEEAHLQEKHLDTAKKGLSIISGLFALSDHTTYKKIESGSIWAAIHSLDK